MVTSFKTAFKLGRLAQKNFTYDGGRTCTYDPSGQFQFERQVANRGNWLPLVGPSHSRRSTEHCQKKVFFYNNCGIKFIFLQNCKIKLLPLSKISLSRKSCRCLYNLVIPVQIAAFLIINFHLIISLGQLIFSSPDVVTNGHTYTALTGNCNFKVQL